MKDELLIPCGQSRTVIVKKKKFKTKKKLSHKKRKYKFGVMRRDNINPPNTWFSMNIFKYQLGFGPDHDRHFLVYAGTWIFDFGWFMTDYGFKKWMESIESDMKIDLDDLEDW